MVFQLCALSFPFSRKDRFKRETFLKSRAIPYLPAINVKWLRLEESENGEITSKSMIRIVWITREGRSFFIFFSSKTSNLFVFQEISKSRFSFIFDFVSSRNTNGFHRIQFSLSMESATRWKGLNSVHRILNTPVTSINRIRSELFFCCFSADANTHNLFHRAFHRNHASTRCTIYANPRQHALQICFWNIHKLRSPLFHITVNESLRKYRSQSVSLFSINI